MTDVTLARQPSDPPPSHNQTTNLQTSDPQLYARSFADVYRDWYDDLDDPTVMVQSFRRRCAEGACIVELGSGTGRLASPLHDAGFRVVALDASLEMLELAASGPRPIAADMAAMPLASGSADAALVAYNTLLNLDSHEEQQRCFAEIARVVRRGGVAAIESFIATSDGATPFGVTIRQHPVNPDARVAIITGPDPNQPDVIVGSHVELGSPLVCRPWRLLYQSPQDLDMRANAAGMALVERHSDWAGTPFDESGHRHVSWYERV